MSFFCCNDVSTRGNSSIESKINESLLNKINLIFKVVLDENKNLKNYPDKIMSQKNMPFYSNYIPSISTKNYLFRIVKYTEIEDNTLILALIYIDRICDIAKIILTPYNIHKIIFTAILLAIKYNEDMIFNFEYYSKVAGISINEMQILEKYFAILLRYKFFVSNEIFENYKLYIDNIDDKEENRKDIKIH